MTVSTLNNRVSYAGNGVTTEFSFPNRFLADADLMVLEVNDTTGVETPKTLTTHYTVTGAGDAAGGTVTMLTAPATGMTLVIYRDPALTQPIDLVNGDPLDVDTGIERGFDRSTLQIQRVRDLIDRTMRLPEGDTGFTAADMELPAKVDRASRLLAFDADGKPLASAGTGGTATSAFMATVVDDLTAAAALTTLGFSDFAQTLRDDTTSNATLTTLTATRADTAATAVPVLTKLRERMSVFDFLSDVQIAEVIARAGTSDLSTPIQAAITAAAAAGKTLYFPGGIYDVGVMLTVTTNNTALVADGDVTLRRRAAAAIASVLHVGFDTATQISSPIVHGFKFDGNAGCTGAVLKIKNVTLGSFHDLEITGGAAIGLRTDTSTDAINTKQLRNEYFNIRSHANATIGMLFQGEKDSRYVDLFAHNNTTDGIYFKAFKFDGDTLTETTQCTFGVLVSRDNGGNGFVMDGVEKYTGAALLSAINGGAGIKFLSTLVSTSGNAGNSLTLASFSSRNDAGGGIRMADSANVNSASFAAILLIGFSSALSSKGVELHGVANVYFGTVRVVGYHGTAVNIQSGTPLGVAAESSNIHFGTLHLDANGDATAVSNHGLYVDNVSSDITIGTLISANSQTAGTNYELNVAATAGPIVINYAHLTPAAAANAMNVGTSNLHFNKLKIAATAMVSTIYDGVTAPAANVSSQAQLYIDAADGDLKIRFANGFVRTIALDS